MATNIYFRNIYHFFNRMEYKKMKNIEKGAFLYGIFVVPNKEHDTYKHYAFHSLGNSKTNDNDEEEQNDVRKNLNERIQSLTASVSMVDNSLYTKYRRFNSFDELTRYRKSFWNKMKNVWFSNGNMVVSYILNEKFLRVLVCSIVKSKNKTRIKHEYKHISLEQLERYELDKKNGYDRMMAYLESLENGQAKKSDTTTNT